MVTVSENNYFIVDFKPDQAIEIYSAFPLLTCFAFIIYYRTSKGEAGGVIYHAKSGYPDRFREIQSLLAGSTFTHALIAIPDEYENGLDITKRLVREGVTKLKTFFGVEPENVMVREKVNFYSMDNSGQHGFAIIETRQGRISTELIMEQRRFLTELTAEIKSREFTILNWLGCKVRGLPDGVKEISKLLSVWQSNTQDANVVAECYQSVLKELQSCLDKKSADRQPGTYDFYFEWLDRSLSLKQVGLQKYIKY